MRRNPYYVAKCMSLLMLAIIMAIILLLIPSIQQDPAYHNFSDQRTIFSIHHFMNVFSNGLFVLSGLIGVWGIYLSRQAQTLFHFRNRLERHIYGVFFFILILLGVASGYYHLNPNNQTLIWDRMAIVTGLATLMSAIVSERVQVKLAIYLWPVLVVLGLLSVWYWSHSELLGVGDLRFYLFMEFYPVFAVTLVLLLFEANYTHSGYLVAAIILFFLAKVFEFYDAAIFAYLRDTISGHTLKHVLSGIASLLIVVYLHKRAAIIHVHTAG